MKHIIEKIEKIKTQSKNWLWFAQVSPILILIIAAAIYGIQNSAIPSILYASWILLIMTSIIWWAWVIKVISEMANMFDEIIKMVKGVHRDIIEVRKELEKD